MTQLNSALQAILAYAQLTASPLPELALQLWLIDPSSMLRQFKPARNPASARSAARAAKWQPSVYGVA